MSGLLPDDAHYPNGEWVKVLGDSECCFPVGASVRHRLHTKAHDGWIGYVTAVEVFTDFHGQRRWIWVRWIDPHGKVLDDSARMSASELTLVSGKEPA